MPLLVHYGFFYGFRHAPCLLDTGDFSEERNTSYVPASIRQRQFLLVSSL